MADMTGTTLATYLPEVWSKKATIVYANNTVLAPLMDRRWEPELGVGQGDTVNIPTFTESNTANLRGLGTGTFGTGAAITFSAPTEAQVQLLVNAMAYKAFRLPVEMSAQVMPQYPDMLTQDIGGGIARQIDSDLAGNNTNGIDAATTTIGTDNVDVTDDDILTCETNVNAANAPASDRYLVVSPQTRGSMMKIDVLRNQLYSTAVGNLDGSKGNGYIGNVYSFAVHMTTNLEAGTAGHKNGAGHKEGIALCVQKAVTIVKTLNIQDGLFNQVAGYAVYGFKLVKTNFIYELDGK